MHYKQDVVDELRNKHTVSSIVGLRVKLEKRGNEFQGLCPFHNERTPSFTVSDEKGFYHCFGCGAHGDIIKFIMETEKLTFNDAVDELKSENIINARLEFKRNQARETQSIPQTLDKDFFTDWICKKNSYLDIEDKIKLSLGIRPTQGYYSKKQLKQLDLIKNKVKQFNDGKLRDIKPVDIIEVSFQFEQEFPSFIVEAYKEVTGKELQYLEYSPVLKLYKRWSAFDLLTLEQSICLVHGMSPDLTEIENPMEDSTLLKGIDPLFPFKEDIFNYSKQVALTSIKAKKLDIHHTSNGVFYFEPKIFVQWAITKNWHPHKLFLDFIGYNKTENNISAFNESYSTCYIELLKKAIKFLSISKENQPKAEQLQEWFIDNAPIEANISPSKAKYLATFARLPESGRGGNKKFKL